MTEEIEITPRQIVSGVLSRFGMDTQFRDEWTEAFICNLNAMVTQDPATMELKTSLSMVADIDIHPELNAQITSMILGESGTGKELCAQILHGKRRGAFVAANCAAIPAELFEAEMFGYKKGAFTGAHVDTKGKFVSAEGGTLFLDEVGDLSLAHQAKILRALETREVTPLGVHVPVRFNCQIISATNHDIKRMVLNKQFRTDLYYRLSVNEFHTIPLRDRPDDVPLILSAFRRRYKMTDDDSVPDVSVYSEGNVRALRSWAIRKEIGTI